MFAHMKSLHIFLNIAQNIPHITAFSISLHQNSSLSYILSFENKILNIRNNYSSKCILYFLRHIRVESLDCGDEVAAWLESVLATPGVRLVRQCSNDERVCSRKTGNYSFQFWLLLNIHKFFLTS